MLRERILSQKTMDVLSTRPLCLLCVTGIVLSAVFFSGCSGVHRTHRNVALVESLLTTPADTPTAEPVLPADLVFSQEKGAQSIEEKILPPIEHISVQPHVLAGLKNEGRVSESMPHVPQSAVYDHYYIKVQKTDGHSTDEARAIHFQWPVKGVLMCLFHGCGGGEGVDIRVDPQAPIYAAAAGRVVFAEENVPHYGRIIVMKHGNDWVTVYTRMKKILVQQGDVLRVGHCIATTTDDQGHSAESIHFEIRHHGHAVDPSTLIGEFPQNM